ncbi:galactokinase, partial [Nocardioides sp.]
MTMVTTRAPGRVNLIGEHTDYNGGLCLPFAIPLATTAAVSTRPDDLVVVTSDGAGRWQGTLEEISSRAVTGWPAYVAGVIWSLQESGWAVPGLDITLESTVPLGAGLSSSAALECAVGVAIATLLDRPLDDPLRRFLAEACRRAEADYVRAPTGGLDQLASLLGAEEHAVLVDFEDPAAPRAERVPLPLCTAGLAILITDTGVRHELADGDGGYAQRRAECEAAAAALGVPSLRGASLDDVERLPEVAG